MMKVTKADITKSEEVTLYYPYSNDGTGKL